MQASESPFESYKSQGICSFCPQIWIVASLTCKQENGIRKFFISEYFFLLLFIPSFNFVCERDQKVHLQPKLSPISGIKTCKIVNL